MANVSVLACMKERSGIMLNSDCSSDSLRLAPLRKMIQRWANRASYLLRSNESSICRDASVGLLTAAGVATWMNGTKPRAETKLTRRVRTGADSLRCMKHRQRGCNRVLTNSCNSLSRSNRLNFCPVERVSGDWGMSTIAVNSEVKPSKSPSFLT
jgi:hypothetical protein